MAKSRKFFTFDGVVQSFDPATRIVVLQDGNQFQLGPGSEQKPTAGQNVKISIDAKSKDQIGTSPVRVERFVVSKSETTSATSSGGVNTTDRQ